MSVTHLKFYFSSRKTRGKDDTEKKLSMVIHRRRQSLTGNMTALQHTEEWLCKNRTP